ncbi:MAG: phosphatase PAP2 family protein [Bacillota bacterium]|nr:phosphatase PAP2 family protein [Bacillota bacterium]
MRLSRLISVTILSTIFSLIIVQLLLKNLIGRARPFEVIEGINLFIKRPTSYSFPSGHSSISGIGFMLSFYYLKKKTIKYTSMTVFFLIAISRLIIRVHFLSDVIVGFMLAVTIVFLVKKYYNKKI